MTGPSPKFSASHEQTMRHVLGAHCLVYMTWSRTTKW